MKAAMSFRVFFKFSRMPMAGVFIMGLLTCARGFWLGRIRCLTDGLVDDVADRGCFGEGGFGSFFAFSGSQFLEVVDLFCGKIVWHRVIRCWTSWLMFLLHEARCNCEGNVIILFFWSN